MLRGWLAHNWAQLDSCSTIGREVQLFAPSERRCLLLLPSTITSAQLGENSQSNRALCSVGIPMPSNLAKYAS
jgi:hypothetical protein